MMNSTASGSEPYEFLDEKHYVVHNMNCKPPKDRKHYVENIINSKSKKIKYAGFWGFSL